MLALAYPISMKHVLRSKYDATILALALPALGALAADPLVSLVDTAFVGRLGTTPLAALGINAALFNMAFFVFTFLAYGATPLISHALARGDSEAAGRTAAQALLLALTLGIGVSAVLLTFAQPLLGLMGADATLLAPASDYLYIRALAGPAVLLIVAANGIFRGLQDTRTPLLITLSVSAANLVLDPLFIFGFGWGIKGAALATLIAQYLGAAWFILLLLRPNSALPLRTNNLTLAAFAPFLKIGWELILRSLSLVGTFTLATAIVTRLGVLEIATHQVVFQLWLFLALVVDALAIAAQALVSRYLGEENSAAARAVANRLITLSLIYGTLLGLAFWALQPYLPGLFSQDPDVLLNVKRIYGFVTFTQTLNAVNFVLDGIFIGASKFKLLAWAMLVSALITSALLLLVLPLGWGLVGVWWVLTMFMVLRLGILGGWYWRRGLA